VKVMSEPTLVFQPYGKRLKATAGKNLLEAAREIGINLNSVCGGRGVCGKCRVIIRSGKENISPPSDAERRHLSEDDLNYGFRLACQSLIESSGVIVIEIPYESQVDKQRLLLRGLETTVSLSPAVKRITVHLEEPSLVDVKSDADRLIGTIEADAGLELRLDYETLKQLPHILRKNNWAVTVMVWKDQEIISVGSPVSINLYGLAVDIGTTKLAAYLVNLSSGKIVAVASRMNPQIVFGEDVISRIFFIMQDKENLAKLQHAVIDDINWLISEACQNAGASPGEIYDMTVAGNTAMHHIFLGVPPNYVSLMPYPAALQSPLDVKARELGVNINRGAYVHVLPTIAGFVGGDAVADVLATGVYDTVDLTMLIDIGTNTEIVLGSKDRFMACSCASGPAFEGAHIRHGMRAISGAIEHVWIDPKTFDVGYKTIDDERPRGLCGSAVIDITAEMLKAGVIDHSGRFNMKLGTPRLRNDEKSAEFVIAWKEETAIKSDIAVTQADIREVQLAKAAVYTGASILMRHMKVAYQDIRKVFLAGAFGNYVDPQSARVIGMYPEVPLERVQFVGNTAGSGARMALLSVDARKAAEKIAERVGYLELGADPDFQNEFLKATYLPHQEIERFPKISKMLEKRTEK